MVSSDEINKRLEAKRRGIKYQEPIGRTNTERSTADFKECPSCHTQNPPTAKFCVGCGEKLETPPEEKGFSPEIKGPESSVEENTTVEKPIKSNIISQRPDDFSKSRQQKVKPEPSPNKKLEPIVPESPEIIPEPESEINSTPEPKPPEPPQVKRPETIPTPEPQVERPVITPTPEPQIKKSSPKATEEKPKSEVDPVERIKKAKELLDIGAITQEEFDIIKKKYLDEI